MHWHRNSAGVEHVRYWKVELSGRQRGVKLPQTNCVIPVCFIQLVATRQTQCVELYSFPVHAVHVPPNWA